MSAALPWPVWCTELELGAPLPELLLPPAAGGYRSARVLLRLHGEALGYASADLGAGPPRAADLVAGVREDVVARAREHLRREQQAAANPIPRQQGHGEGPVTAADLAAGLPAPGVGCPSRVDDGPSVTVAVCTRDRGEALRTCLERLRDLRYRRLEVLVVDNAPSGDAAAGTSAREVFDACVGGDARFRYTLEPRPGLSWARNHALAEATGELLAYTDDDVEVDPLWVDGLVRGFAGGPGVGCVTGLVVTAAIDGPAEAYFDGRASWGDSCVPRVFSLAVDGHDRLFPYSPGVFGTGANVAFRTELLRRLGGFDVALGAGTVAAGGEDLDAFVRVVNAGYSLVYSPAALVRHHHRSDLDGLGRQMFAYGAGLTAFLAKHLLDPRTRVGVVRRIPAGLWRMARIPATTAAALAVRRPAPDPDRSPDGGHAHAPDPVTAAALAPVAPSRALLVREFAGLAAGPVLYLRSRRRARALAAGDVGERAVAR